MNECLCRNCNKQYDMYKSRAEYQGYCSMKCQHAKAKELGYKQNGTQTEYQVLNSNNAIGSIPAPGI